MTIAHGIFSGGLDSILAAILIKKQGIEPRLLTFVTPFFGAEKAMESATAIGMELRAVDISQEHLEMMQRPKHGFGRYMNPCIDCHALMFRKAGEIMEREGGAFIFSGEVLGQRPKSQNRRALDIVAHASGYADFILRPLSALALPPTGMEERGVVDREKLQGFSGRTRKPQMALAEELGVTDYPSPAGGCLLTDPIFSRRLKELSSIHGFERPREIELLKHGRHFRLPDDVKVVVGRNKADNDAIEKWVLPEDMVIRVAGIPGPVVLLPSMGGLAPDHPSVALAASMAVSYSDAPSGEPVKVLLKSGEGEIVVEAEGRPKSDFSDLMI